MALAEDTKTGNWGRWGADDQRGTLNLIDTEAVQRGIQSARTGRPFSLAIPFDRTGPQWDSKNMPERVNPVEADVLVSAVPGAVRKVAR